MDERSTKRLEPITLLMTSRRLYRWTVLVAALSVHNVVSFGPVCRFAPSGSTKGGDPLIEFYKPLLRLADSSGWQWPGEALRYYGGERAMWMQLIVLITDTVIPRTGNCVDNTDDSELEEIENDGS